MGRDSLRGMVFWGGAEECDETVLKIDSVDDCTTVQIY